MMGVTTWVLLACSGPGDGGDTASGGDDTGRPDTDTEVLDDTGPDDTDTDETGETDTGPDDDAAYEAFFAPDVVQRIDLELSEEALAALRADPDTYVEGVFVHDGYRHESVGIRLKGGASTFEDIDGKPSFRLKLDEFVDGLDYGGLDRLNLHNMKADPAQAREVAAYWTLAAAGVVAPRANFAEVYVNGESRGVYANVEEIDGSFRERHFEDPSGDLWEAGDGADFTPAGVEHYSAVGGEGDFDALDAARRQIQTGDGAFYDVADVVLDMDQFLAFWAWQVALGNEDGYPYELDDHALYADPTAAGRYTYVPWGLDETWDAAMDWEAYSGTVAVQCAYDDACLALFKAATRDALEAYEAADTTAIVQSAMDVSLSAVTADTRRELPLADVTYARAQLANIVLNRPNIVRSQMGI